MAILGAEEIYKKISPLIESQFPAIIREEGPKFVLFLKAYYEFLEQQGGAVNATRSLVEYQDVDKTLDSFIEYFRREFMVSIPKNTLADQKLLVKHIRDFYRTKGSEFSYRFLFRTLYNKEIDIFYPGDYILRASDGRWLKETLLRVGSPFTGNPLIFEGKNITGLISGARARVQGVTRTTVLGLDLYELIVEGVIGTFRDGETVSDQDGNTATIESRFGSIVDIISINDGGAYHTIGDTLTISSGGATARAIVTSSSPQGAAIIRINSGGSGYRTDGNTVISVVGGSGNGLSARVISLSNSTTISLNSDIIRPMANVVLNTGSTFVSLGTNTASVSASLAAANITSQLTTALTFASVTIGSINAISITSVGRGYNTSLPTVTVTDQVISEQRLPGEYGNFRGGDAVLTAEIAPGSINDISIISSDASFDRLSTAEINNDRGTATTPIAYIDAAGITRYTVRANTYSGLLTPEVSGVISLPGRYADTKGFLSWSNRLQDNRFYQEYSYVVRVVDITLGKYKEILKKMVHPAGVALFGQYQSFSTLPHPNHTVLRGENDTASRMAIFANNISRLYETDYLSISTRDLNSSGVEFSPSGRKMYMVGINNDSVWQFNLSKEFDLSTAVYSGKSLLVANTQNKNSSPGDNAPTDIRFKPDGSKIFVLGNTREILEQYDLSTAWDISTAYISLDKLLTETGDVINTESSDRLGDYDYTTTPFQADTVDLNVTGFAFKPDGTKMFMTGSTYDNVVECDLTIPWDIRTANANFNNIIMENGDILVAQDGFNIVLEDSKFFAFGSQDATMNSITFSQNGARMFVTGTTNDKLFSYNLSTPWDVRTANYVSQLDLTPGTSPTGIFLNTDETKMFIIDSFLDRIRMFQIQPRLLNEDQTSLLSELSEYLVQQ
jgi:hypothetical protein